MVGLAETSSLIATILYWLETAVRVRNNTSCTSQPNTWLPPSLPNVCEQVPYVTLEELEGISQRQSSMDVSSNGWENIAKQPQSTEDLQALFFSQLNDVADRKPGIFSLVLNLSFTVLLASAPQICTETATEFQIKHLEELTRGQAYNTVVQAQRWSFTASQIYQVDSVLICSNVNYVILIGYA